MSRSLISRRFNSSVFRTVAKCPPPQYDTGCTYCQIPAFPPSHQVDYERNLNGTKSDPWKHLLVLSHGIANFDTMPSKIELIPGSLSSEINILKRDLFSPVHPVLVSNILLQKHSSLIDEFSLNKNEQLVYLYPEGKAIKFNIADTKQFIRKFLVPEDYVVQATYNPFKKSAGSDKVLEQAGEFEYTEYPISKGLVLICGHTQRDIRCGKIAPLLEEEFSKVLTTEQLLDTVDVGLISHIGGHAYAGNVIYFPPNRSKAVWYGRVFPDKVQGIVKETIIGENVIEELYRGNLE